MNEESIVTYDRISRNPANFEAVFTRQLSLADELRAGKVAVDRGSVEGKALYGAVKSLDVDIRARMLEHRERVYLDAAKALPNAGERSGAAQVTDERSRGQVAESAAGTVAA